MKSAIIYYIKGIVVAFDEKDAQMTKYQGRITFWKWVRLYWRLKH